MTSTLHERLLTFKSLVFRMRYIEFSVRYEVRQKKQLMTWT